MSNIENGRLLVKTFVEDNGISEQDLAAAYGKSRAWIQKILKGTETGPAVNTLILEIIRDFKIRGDK